MKHFQVMLGFIASNCIIFGEYALFACDAPLTPTMHKTLANLCRHIPHQRPLFLCPPIEDDIVGWAIPRLALELSYAVDGLFQGLVPLRLTGEPHDRESVPAHQICLFSIVPLEKVKASVMIAALFFKRVFGPQIGRIILPLALTVSAVGNLMVATFTLARVYQEVACQGFFPYAALFSSTKPYGGVSHLPQQVFSPFLFLLALPRTIPNTNNNTSTITYTYTKTKNSTVPFLLVIALPPSGSKTPFISQKLNVEGYPAQFFALVTSLGLLHLCHVRPDLL
ncbi:unnamed protein product [Diplocarpon coronariae]|nr:hypothetical protein JHW43_000062 [Diplocarpon mali]